MKYSFVRRQRERKIEKVIKELEKVRWQYRNTIFFVISFLLACLLLRNESFWEMFSDLGKVGYLGSF
ncbi:MAG: hypothetical protein ACP5O8_03525, partial [Candidatus Aenigmatarchaeota archaeon]